MCLFDAKRYDEGQSAWTLLVNRSDVPAAVDYKPGMKDYTHFWVLPQPARADGLEYTVAAMGQAGRIHFINVDPNTTLSQRFLTPANGQRPACNAASGNLSAAWDSTAALLR